MPPAFPDASQSVAITFARADSERLIVLLSSRRSPLSPISAARSDPARSTRFRRDSFSADDAAYNIYDKALFRGGAAAESLYRPTRGAQEDEWADEEKAAENVLKAARFKAGDRGFEGSRAHYSAGVLLCALARDARVGAHTL